MKNLASLINLAVVLSGSFALNTQSAEAKTSQSNSTGKAKNFFVPPPPPYTPSVGLWAMGMPNAQAVTAGSDDAAVEKTGNFYSKQIFKHNQGDNPQFVQTSSGIRFNPAIETKIQKHIDDFDSEITNSQKEIGKLLNL